MAREESKQTRNLDARTVSNFGFEWSRFDQTSVDDAELREYFEKYFRVFPWEALPADAVGFDAGCGSGRWAMFVAPRVRQLVCLDASAEAAGVARRNLRRISNCAVAVATVDGMPIQDSSMDFGYSLGVLHHVPDTAAALHSCARKLKPGAPFLVYLYYALDSRSLPYRVLWYLSDYLRNGISSLPAKPRALAADFLALTVYWPLSRLAHVVDAMGGNGRSLPLGFYRNSSLAVLRNDSLDRFGTPVEKRFSKQQILQMLGEAGFERVTFSGDPPYWCAVAYRRKGALD